MKKIVSLIIAISVIGFFAIAFSKKDVAASYNNSAYIGSTLDLAEYEGEYNFNQFMDDNKNVARPKGDFYANLETFVYSEGLFEEDVPKIDFFKDDEGLEKEGVYIPETGNITFEVEVDEAGLYNVELEYYTILGRGASINRGILINGKYQYLEAERVNINRFWADEFKVSDRRVEGIDDIRPRQQEVHLWHNALIEDNMGYYDEPYYFKLNEGVNTVTFVSQREPIVLSEIKFTQSTPVISYEDYLDKHRNALVIEDDFNVTIQAEEALFKSSPTLNPSAEFSTYKYEPYERFITRYNTIGGQSWRVPGDEITWEVTVPKSGMYLINFKVMQNFNRGKNTTRIFRVNGEVPFKEAFEIDFKYSSDLQNTSLGNNEETYLVYFEEGINTISLATTIGVYADVVNRVNIDVKKLRDLYRQIVMRMRLNPDPLQDYMLKRNIPDLDERLAEIVESLNFAREEMINISGTRSELISVFDRTLLQLDKFLEYEKNIQKGLREFEQNISSLASWVMDISEQPLVIDSITIHGKAYEKP